MRKIAFLLAIIGVLIVCGIANAGTFYIPAGTKVIDEEAFYGNAAIDEVVLPDGILLIRDRAYANSGLKKINLPASITHIADSAFDNSTLSEVVAEEGTKGANWAISHGIKIVSSNWNGFTNGETLVSAGKTKAEDGKDVTTYLGKWFTVQDVSGGWFKFTAPSAGSYTFSVKAASVSEAFYVRIYANRTGTISEIKKFRYEKSSDIVTYILQNVVKGETIYWWDARVANTGATFTQPFQIHVAAVSATLNDPKPANITKHPANVSTAVGTTAIFTVTASNAVNFQWQSSMDNKSWSNCSLTGSVTNTLSVPVTRAVIGTYYRCVVTGEDGIAKASNSAQLQESVTTTVKLASTSLILRFGDTVTIDYTITPATAPDKTVTWTSSNLNVAAVDDYGNVEILGTGEAIITATTHSGNSAACKITVPYDELRIDGKTEVSWNLVNGQAASKAFTVKSTRNFYAYSSASWLNYAISGNQIVVSVDAHVSTKAAERTGTVTVSNDTEEATITVKQSMIMNAPVVVSPVLSTNPNAPTERQIGEFKLSVQRKYAGTYLIYTVNKKNSAGGYDYQGGRWHGSSISEMDVHPTNYAYKLAEGETYRIDVLEATGSFYNSAAYYQAQSAKTSLYVTFVAPSAPDYPRGVKAEADDSGITVTWTAVSGAQGYTVHYINSSINVTGESTVTYTIPKAKLTAGTVYPVYVTAYNDAGNSDTYGRSTAYVYWSGEVMISSVNITSEPGRMLKGTSYQLKWTVSPSNATNRTVHWYSSDSDVVSIDEYTGFMQAVGTGEADITAKSDNGTVLEETDVEVYKPVLTRPTVSSAAYNSSSDGIKISWNTSKWQDGSGTIYYRLLRNTKSSGTYTQIVEGLTGTSFTDTGLQKGTTYYYKVEAYGYDTKTSSAVTSSRSSYKSCTFTGQNSAKVTFMVNGQVVVDGGSFGTVSQGDRITVKFTDMTDVKRIYIRFSQNSSGSPAVWLSKKATGTIQNSSSSSDYYWYLPSTAVSGSSVSYYTYVPTSLSDGNYYLELVASPYGEADTDTSGTDKDQTKKAHAIVSFRIEEDYEEPDNDEITSIKIADGKTKFQANQANFPENTIVASVFPMESENSLTWTSSNTSVFKPVVDSDTRSIHYQTGSVSKPTSVTLKASADGKSDSLTLTVYDRPAVKVNGTSVSHLSWYDYDIRKGDLKLTWTVGGSTTAHEAYTAIYSKQIDLNSDGSANDGRLSTSYNDLYSAGSASLTIPSGVLQAGQYIKLAVKSYGVSWTTIGIHLIDSVVSMTDVTIAGDDQIGMMQGESGTLTASYLPAVASNKNLIWKSSDTSVVTVTGSGTSAKLNAVGAGKARVMVYSESDPDIGDSVQVSVVRKTIDISGGFSVASGKVTAGDQYQLQGQAIVTNSTLKQVTVNVKGYNFNNQFKTINLSGKKLTELDLASARDNSNNLVFNLDTGSAPFNDGNSEYTLELYASEEGGSYKSLGQMTLYIVPKEVEFTGGFSVHTAAVEKGKTYHLAGDVGVTNSTVKAVKITVDGYAETEADSFMQLTTSGKSSINLGSFDQFIVDTGKSPLNKAGAYTLKVYVTEAGGAWKEVDQFILNVMDPTPANLVSKSLDVYGYLQGDSRWGSEYVNDNAGTLKTIASVGCAVTSVAMTERYRKSDDESVTPLSIKDNYSFSGNAIVWANNKSDWASYTGIASNGEGTASLTAEAVMSECYKNINNGKPSVIGLNTSSLGDGNLHYVVVYGYKNLDPNNMTLGCFLVKDPANARFDLDAVSSKYYFRQVYTYGGAARVDKTGAAVNVSRFVAFESGVSLNNTWYGSGFIGTKEEVTSNISYGTVADRTGYPLNYGQTIDIPFSTDTSAVKVKVLLTSLDEAMTYASSEATSFSTVNGKKTGNLRLALPNTLYTGNYRVILESQSSSGSDASVRARCEILIKGKSAWDAVAAGKDVDAGGAKALIKTGEATAWTNSGSIRYVQQYYGGNDLYYTSYWAAQNVKHMCDVASASMGLSYMGINKMPKDVTASCTFSDSNRIESIGELASVKVSTFSSKTDFIAAYNNYVNNQGATVSPIMIFTKWGNGGTGYHSIVIFAHDAEDPSLFYAIDPGAGSYWNLKRVRFVEVSGKLLIQDVYYVSTGGRSTIYGKEYTPVYYYQYSK